jgi:hypothetical protein
MLDLALACQLAGDLGAELSACESATFIAPDSPQAWSRYAHALARSDRVRDCIIACERALDLAPGEPDPEVSDLLERCRALEPRVLPAA